MGNATYNDNKKKNPINRLNVTGYTVGNRYVICQHFEIYDVTDNTFLLDENEDTATFYSNAPTFEFLRNYVFQHPDKINHKFEIKKYFTSDYVSEE